MYSFDEIFTIYLCCNSAHECKGLMLKENGLFAGSHADFLEECLRTKMLRNESKTYTCILCEKICGDLSNARFHLESKHFPNYDGYHCPVCNKFCKTKNALACHKVKCRRSLQA